EFTDPIPLTDAARKLPEMQGSGWVRDLREAMSLDTDAGSALQRAVARFSADTTRDAQRADIDSVLQAWAASTARLTHASPVREMTATTVTSDTNTQTIRWSEADPCSHSDDDRYAAARFEFPADAYYSWEDNGAGIPMRLPNADAMQVMRKLSILEVFNGS